MPTSFAPWQRFVRRALITWFGCGDMPFASGTWGSAGALVPAAAWYFVCRASHSDAAKGALVFHGGIAVGLLVWCVLCVRWGPWAVETFANHHNTRKPGDPGAFVLDEVAGQWLSLLWLPLASTVQRAVIVVAVQFVLFRAADVFKPPPGRRLERLPAGWGILLDDLSSAVYVNLVGQLIFRIWLEWT